MCVFAKCGKLKHKFITPNAKLKTNKIKNNLSKVNFWMTKAIQTKFLRRKKTFMGKRNKNIKKEQITLHFI